MTIKKVLKEEINKESDDEFSSLLTSLISEGWDKVGILKSQISTIGEDFKGGEKIIDVLQGLMDGYLVYIGQLEAILDETAGIASVENPGVTEIGSDPTIKVVDSAADVDAPTIKVASADDATIDAPVVKVETDEVKSAGAPFEFFVDEFPEAEISGETEDDNPFRPIKR